MTSYVPIDSEELVADELREITDSNELGVCLNVPRRTLKEIERQYSHVHGPRRCKSEVIGKWWRRTPDANWGDVIAALKEMDEYRLARELEKKYRMNASRPTTCTHSDLSQRISGGYTISHGPICLAVSADIPKQLINLMQRYADMLLLLRMSSLPPEKMKVLRFYLYDLCEDQLFLDCSSPEAIVEQLKRYISMFSIDILLIIIIKFIEFQEAVQEYDKFRQEFLSNTAVHELKDAFNKQAPLESSVESITLKLKEMGTDFTLKALRKLAYHLFGISYKAMILFDVRAGCIAVTWVVPVSLVPMLKKNIEQCHSLTDLQRLGVLELVIGHWIVTPEYKAQIREAVVLKHELSRSEALVRELMKQLEEKHQAYDRLKGTMGNMEMKMTSQLTEAQENVLKREEENRALQRQLQYVEQQLAQEKQEHSSTQQLVKSQRQHEANRERRSVSSRISSLISKLHLRRSSHHTTIEKGIAIEMIPRPDDRDNISWKHTKITGLPNGKEPENASVSNDSGRGTVSLSGSSRCSHSNHSQCTCVCHNSYIGSHLEPPKTLPLQLAHYGYHDVDIRHTQYPCSHHEQNSIDGAPKLKLIPPTPGTPNTPGTEPFSVPSPGENRRDRLQRRHSMKSTSKSLHPPPTLGRQRSQSISHVNEDELTLSSNEDSSTDAKVPEGLGRCRKRDFSPLPLGSLSRDPMAYVSDSELAKSPSGHVPSPRRLLSSPTKIHLKPIPPPKEASSDSKSDNHIDNSSGYDTVASSSDTEGLFLPIAHNKQLSSEVHSITHFEMHHRRKHADYDHHHSHSKKTSHGATKSSSSSSCQTREPGYGGVFILPHASSQQTDL